MRHSSLSILIICVWVTLVVIGCQSNPDPEALRLEILALHQTDIDAHWEKNADHLAGNLAEDFFSVGNGEIRQPSPAEILAGFESYLTNTTFTEYRDLREPIIGFSDDGSVAWAIVQVKVAGNRKAEDGSNRKVDFTCAWITLYRRQGDGWLKLGDVSSFK
jgi:hypothetical protein